MRRRRKQGREEEKKRRGGRIKGDLVALEKDQDKSGGAERKEKLEKKGG